MDKISLAIEQSINDIGILFSFMDADTDDIDLTEYIEDSVQFVQFIVALEDNLNIEIPDALLNFELLTSWNGFKSMLEDILNC
jgi:acyl carrier protein